jgi:hypothetical protein
MLSVAGTANPTRAQEANPTGQGGPQRIETRIGTLEFTHNFANGYPTDATIEKLYDERDFQRACQAYLWSLPAVSFASWQRGPHQQKTWMADQVAPGPPFLFAALKVGLPGSASFRLMPVVTDFVDSPVGRTAANRDGDGLRPCACRRPRT